MFLSPWNFDGRRLSPLRGEHASLQGRNRCDPQWPERLNSVWRVIAMALQRAHPIRTLVKQGANRFGTETRYGVFADRRRRTRERRTNPSNSNPPLPLAGSPPRIVQVQPEAALSCFVELPPEPELPPPWPPEPEPEPPALWPPEPAPPAPAPQRSGTDSFFDAMRRVGVVRAEGRDVSGVGWSVIGGVLPREWHASSGWD